MKNKQSSSNNNQSWSVELPPYLDQKTFDYALQNPNLRDFFTQDPANFQIMYKKQIFGDSLPIELINDPQYNEPDNQNTSSFNRWKGGTQMKDAKPRVENETALRENNIIQTPSDNPHITTYHNLSSIYRRENASNLGFFTIGFNNIEMPIETELSQYNEKSWKNMKNYSNVRDMMKNNSEVKAKNLVYYFLNQYDIKKFASEIKDQNEGLQGEGRNLKI